MRAELTAALTAGRYRVRSDRTRASRTGLAHPFEPFTFERSRNAAEREPRGLSPDDVLGPSPVRAGT